MFNAYYDNFYQGCLNDKITIKKYIPIKKYLIKLVNYTENLSKYHTMSKDYKTVFTMSLLSLSNIIIGDDNHLKLDEYIDYLIDKEIEPLRLVRYLNLMLYKEKGFKRVTDYLQAFSAIEYDFENLDIEPQEGDHRLIQLIKIFIKHKRDEQITTYINSFGKRIVADFYKTELDPIYLDTLFTKKALNQLLFELYKYDKNNKWYQRYTPLEFTKMIMNDTGIKRTIK